MIKELNHVAVRTGNMEAALHFYVDILGAKVIRDATSPDGKGRFVYVQLVDGVIEIIKGKPGADNLGLQHVAFLISDDTDIHQVRERLGEMGYEFTVEPKLASSGDGYLAFFKDSSGAIFELIQRKENIRIPGLKNEHLEEFDHISIRVADDNHEKCADFYLNTMGFQVRRILEKPKSVMSYYKFGPDTIETLYPQGRPKVEKPLCHIAFRVKDCYEMKKYLESQGVTCPEPKESGMGGFNVMNVTGPDGEILEFLDRASLDEYGR